LIRSGVDTIVFAAIPVPGKKSDHRIDGDVAIAGHDLPVE
jgi:hypothetical protein